MDFANGNDDGAGESSKQFNNEKYQSNKNKQQHQTSKHTPNG